MADVWEKRVTLAMNEAVQKLRYEDVLLVCFKFSQA